MNKNVAIVYKRVIAQKLLQEGFKIIDIQPNNNDNRYTVFFFADEGNIRKRIKELSNWT